MKERLSSIWSKSWVRYTTVAVVALGIGGAAATAEPEEVVVERVVETEVEVPVETIVEREIEVPVETVVEVEVPATAEELAALDEREALLDERESALDTRELALDERESALIVAEEIAAMSVIARDGLYLVGTDIVAGTYKADGDGTGCYWEITSDASGEFGSLVSNHFGDALGQRIQVRDGQYVSVSDCGEWAIQP